MQPNFSNHDGIFSNMSVLYTCVHFHWKKTLVDMIGILSGVRMRGLHDKPHLLAKLRICGRVNWVGCGYLVAVMGSVWLLRGLRGCYGVYMAVVGSMSSSVFAVLGQLPTTDNSPPDENKAHCPPGPQSLGLQSTLPKSKLLGLKK